MERRTIDPMHETNDLLLQRVFLQMVEGIDDTRVRNLINKHIKNYKQAEDYLNDAMLVYKWGGVGRMSAELIGRFLQRFYEECQAIVNGQSEWTAEKLAAMDYPFLTAAEQAFVASFLLNEGRYPVLFIASRYLQRSPLRHVHVFALANGITGGHQPQEEIARQYGLTRERVRQLGTKSIVGADDARQTWNVERWSSTGLLSLPLLTEKTVHWDELRQKEHLHDMDFYAALTIIGQMAPLRMVAMRTDGRRANSRLNAHTPWQTPDILFAYDKRLECFAFEEALSIVGHEASRQRIADSHMSLTDIVSRHFTDEHTHDDYLAIAGMMGEVLPLFHGVEVHGNDILLRANRTNYAEEIYQILQRRSLAMTVDEIYSEFRLLHPDDHHTDSSFIRNYMLRDERFEAVGSKSTYQLREWQRFAGALGDLAVHLLADSDEPVKVETLCEQMMEQRPTTTMKSCNTSIYLAVTAGRLLFYVDADCESGVQPTAPEVSRYYVGLARCHYPPRFWPSTLTVDGAVSSMRRFIQENGRWPFASGKTGIEPMLYYALRKYKNKRCVSDEELQRYEQAMADITADDYPANERDLQYMNRCRELADYCERHHQLPTSGKLLAWYHALRSADNELTSFRRYQLEKLQACIASSIQRLPVTPIRLGPHTTEQLLLDFSE